MSVENKDIIDFISTDKDLGKVILTISDHLDWNENIMEHLLALQEKVNTYIAFVESGEIYESYPDAKGKKLVVEIAYKHSLIPIAIDFYKKTEEIINSIGIELKLKLYIMDLNG